MFAVNYHGQEIMNKIDKVILGLQILASHKHSEPFIRHSESGAIMYRSCLCVDVAHGLSYDEESDLNDLGWQWMKSLDCWGIYI